MPRESRAIPKMIGLENEYGCALKNLPDGLPMESAGVPFIVKINPQWFSLEKSGSWDPTERLSNIEINDEKHHAHLKDKDWHAMNFLMPNGARLYCDMTHPEISIPICRNAQEALMQDRACEWLMNFIREKHQEHYGYQYVLYKNNTAGGFEDDFSTRRSGVSYATHENYLVSRRTPIEDLYAKVLPFLILRTAFTGAGKVGGQRMDSSINFQISQRAEYFGQPLGVDTTGYSRPIYNLRDRPYADPQRFRRLHVIPGDANMCEVAEFLKFATMQVLLMMIEDEYLDSRFSLNDPVSSFHKISRDLTFKERVVFKGKRPSRTCLDALKEYAELMWNYLETFNIQDEMLRYGVKEMGRVLDMLATCPESCFGILDHVTKKMLIEIALKNGKISSWKDPNAKTMDMKYHNINSSESLFYKPKTYQHMKRLITNEEIQKAAFEPPPTRSRFQVEVHKRFGLIQWDWRKVYIADENGNMAPPIFLEDPAISWEKLEGLLSDDRKEFLKRVKDAGLLESSQDHDNPDEKFYGLSYGKGRDPKPRHRHIFPETKPGIGPIREDDDVSWWPDFSYKKMLDDLKKRDLTDDDPGQYNGGD